MKYLLKIMFICLFFLIIGCTKNSTENNTDFINGELLHPIQCKAVNLSCDDKLEKSVQCKGITQAKERCKNNTTNACNYCYLHIDQAPPPGQCLNQTKNVSGYCEYHKDLVK